MSERQISMMCTENVSNSVLSSDYKGSQVVCFATDACGNPACNQGGTLVVQCVEGQNCCTDTEKSFTLQAGRPDDHHIPDVCYPINLMVATRGGRDDMRTCFGIENDGDPQFTLSSAHEHAVCYPVESVGHDIRSTQFSRGGVVTP